MTRFNFELDRLRDIGMAHLLVAAIVRGTAAGAHLLVHFCSKF